jgi:hypothetical protein
MGDDDKTPPDDPGNPTVDFHGEKRSNDTHASTTDPDTRLARKGRGKEAKLSYSAQALIENRNGLLVDLQMDVADGYAERRTALAMLDHNVPGMCRITVAGDKGCDTSVRRRLPLAERDASCCPERQHAATVQHRRADDGASRVRHQPTHLEASGRGLRMGQDGRDLPKTRYVGFGANQVAACMLAAAYKLVRMPHCDEPPGNGRKRWFSAPC